MSGLLKEFAEYIPDISSSSDLEKFESFRKRILDSCFEGDRYLDGTLVQVGDEVMLDNDSEVRFIVMGLDPSRHKVCIHNQKVGTIKHPVEKLRLVSMDVVDKYESFADKEFEGGRPSRYF